MIMEHVSLDCNRVRDGATVVGNKEDEYRRLARECLRVPHTIVTEEARLALVEMARVWTRLAEEQDTARLPTINDGPSQQSVVQQQQQQIHPKKEEGGK
jgi:hypothetical protein